MPLLIAAAVTRSAFRPENTARKPPPSSPTSAAALTATSSKYTVNCRSGWTSSASMGAMVRPAAPAGTTKIDIGVRADFSRSPARVTTRMASAWSAPEIQYFVPAMR